MMPDESDKTSPDFPPGSIGDLSVQLGQDVRELLMQGYSRDDILSMIAERKRKQQEGKAKNAGSDSGH